MLSYRTDVDFLIHHLPGGEDAEGQNLVDFSYERHETAGLRPDLYRVRMTDVSHYMASDFGIFLRRHGNPFTESLFGFVDGAVANEINNEVVRGFLDQHLRDRKDRSDHGDFPEAQLAKHSAHLVRHDTAHVRDWWLAENPQDRTVRVVFETALGDWALALYPERAPRTAARFLATLDAGGFDDVKIASGASSSKFGTEVGVVALPTTLPEAAPAEVGGTGLPESSGIAYEHGVVAYDPTADGSTAAAWIIHLGEPGRLRYSGVADDTPPDTGPETVDDPATFGRVLYGLRVLESIQRGSFETDGVADGAVVVERAYRVD